jgi:citrate lyase subunit gamma (acyl carrier protein)
MGEPTQASAGAGEAVGAGISAAAGAGMSAAACAGDTGSAGSGGAFVLKQAGVAGTMESGDILVEITCAGGAGSGESGGGATGSGDPEDGLEIDLTSSVDTMFGRQIRRVIAETLAAYGVTRARVRAVDRGALDCTVRARVATALYRGAGRDDYRFD